MSIAYKEKEKRKAYQAAYYQAHKGERKTTTSAEVKQRYNKKTYRCYNLRLRIDTDADLIKSIDNLMATGLSGNEAIKQLLQKTTPKPCQSWRNVTE